MQCSWLGERVASVDTESAIASVLRKQTNESWVSGRGDADADGTTLAMGWAYFQLGCCCSPMLPRVLLPPI